MLIFRESSVAPEGNHLFTHQPYGLVISVIVVGYAAYKANSERVADQSSLAKITASNFEWYFFASFAPYFSRNSSVSITEMVPRLP